jgi:phenylacetate-CoA ligase
VPGLQVRQGAVPEVSKVSLIFDPVAVAQASLQVMAGTALGPRALESLQSSRLRSLLAHVSQTSRFYRERLKGWDPQSSTLRDLPQVSRPELMAHFDEWVSDPAITLSALQTFTADPARVGTSFLGRYLVWESSGSSHEPGIFVQDARTMAVYDALEVARLSPTRPWRRWLDPWCLTERIAFVGATTGHFASVVSAQRLRQNHPVMQDALRCFSILAPAAELLRALNDFEPTVLTSYPSVAAWLAEARLSGKLRTSPREVWTGGETLSPYVRKKIEQAFGCEVRNSYGASEFLPIAWECRAHQLHLNADWVILEPVDARGGPAEPGQLSHSTLLTNLVNRVQPIIRYDLGDRIRMDGVPCSCGSCLPTVEVQGRQDDALVMAGRDGGSVTLLPLALTTVLEEEADIFDFQLRQKDERTLILRLNCSGAEAAHVLERCRHALSAFAQAQAMAPIQLLAEWGKPPGRGRSGKVQRIVARAPT